MAKLTIADKKQIIELVNQGYKIKDIASNFNIAPSYVRRLKSEHLKTKGE